jgi:hypothetical protein
LASVSLAPRCTTRPLRPSHRQLSPSDHSLIRSSRQLQHCCKALTLSFSGGSQRRQHARLPLVESIAPAALRLLLRRGLGLRARGGGSEGAARAGVRSHCRFRNRGTEYISKYGMKRTNGCTKRQRDRALARPQLRQAGEAGEARAAAAVRRCRRPLGQRRRGDRTPRQLAPQPACAGRGRARALSQTLRRAAAAAQHTRTSRTRPGPYSPIYSWTKAGPSPDHKSDHSTAQHSTAHVSLRWRLSVRTTVLLGSRHLGRRRPAPVKPAAVPVPAPVPVTIRARRPACLKRVVGPGRAAAARARRRRRRALHRRPRQARSRDSRRARGLRFGRTVASGKEAPNMLVRVV